MSVGLVWTLQPQKTRPTTLLRRHQPYTMGGEDGYDCPHGNMYCDECPVCCEEGAAHGCAPACKSRNCKDPHPEGTARYMCDDCGDHFCYECGDDPTAWNHKYGCCADCAPGDVAATKKKAAPKKKAATKKK